MTYNDTGVSQLVKMSDDTRKLFERELTEVSLDVEDVNDLLIPLCNLIEEKGFDGTGECSDLGKAAKAAYDDLFHCNHTPWFGSVPDISFPKACEAACRLLGHGLTEIRDLGDCWYFWGCDPEIKPFGPQPIIIFKETGQVTDWMELVFVMHHNDEGELIPVPPEYAYKATKKSVEELTMLKMTEETKAFMKKWLPDVDLAINSLLEPLYDIIMYQGFDENWAYNDFGHEAQAVYDDLYWSNNVDDEP